MKNGSLVIGHWSLKKGFTIAELLISTFILGVLIITATGIYTNFFNSYRNIKAANTVYEEARFTMERIVKEVRSGSVDYEEYYNQAANFFGTSINETYGQNYCQYSRQFYSAGPDNKYGTYDDESTGLRNPDSPNPIENPIQEQLYLIDPTGTRRTYLRRIETTDELGNVIGKVALLKLVGKDYGVDHLEDGENSFGCGRDQGEKDGLVDTWICDEGFNCDSETPGDLPVGCSGQVEIIRDDPDNLANSSYVDITPASLDVVDLKFFITPSDDPRKAYADPDVQIQPHVTIKLIVRASPLIASQIKGSTPDIVLESTISSRTQAEIITECNLQECIDGDIKPCPKNQGITTGAEQTCTQGVWPSCSNTVYENQALENIISGLITPLRMEGELFVPIDPPEPDGLDHEPPFDTEGGRTYYESGKNEMNSCGSDDDCKFRRCHDGVDNDGDGLTDEEDPNCLIHLCNNGYLDPGEDCIDVGGPCYFRPLDLNETNCSDGYDNDCNYNFDLTWQDIVDAGLENYMTYEGLDETSSVAEWNIALRQGADEYDQNCIDITCTNGIQDPVDVTFGPRFYDNPNYLFGKPVSDELNETCIDVGGLCDRFTDTNLTDNKDHHRKVDEGNEVGDLCYDGLDNDCDYDPIETTGGADEFDLDCITTICSNAVFDQGLADASVLDQNPADPDDYIWYDYLQNYSDFSPPLDIQTSLDEVCRNTGGICQTVNPYEEGTETICDDGVDNDCDITFDGNQGIDSDLDCCPDNDNDNFMSPIAVSTCEADDKKTDSYPPYGIIDCNDANVDIRPGTDTDADGLPDEDNPEVCDDATYGIGSPLVGEPIDNNCSFVNARYAVAIGDDGWDHSDPACCVDTDADGFGIQEANLYKGNPPECSATLMALEERPSYDCDDTNANIHPNILENDEEKCTDGINNNCRVSAVTGKERFDHLDTKADPIAALADETFEPECCNVTGFSFNPNLEVCNDTLSLAGDGSNSDENCNGLKGISDHYCLNWDQRSFFDQLSSQTYIQSYDSDNITYADGTYTLNMSGGSIEGEIISDSIPFDPASCPRVLTAQIQSATFDDKAVESGGQTDVVWQLSNDGGANWCGPIDCSGNNWLSGADIGVTNVNFGPNDNDLVWKAKLVDMEGTHSPWLSDIRISFTCP